MSNMFNPHIDSKWNFERPNKELAAEYSRKSKRKVKKRKDGYYQNKGGGKFICGIQTATSV